MLDKKTKILIVGLGLMGGSYAEALTEKGYYVGAFDIDEKAVFYALEKGIIKSGKTEADPDYIGEFDLIIFAVYPHVILDWIKSNQKYIKPYSLITDVTGVKSCFIYDLQEALLPTLEFIGAHPMAGRESSGIINATGKIFEGANYIVTPTEKNTENAIKKCKELGKTLGFTNITELSPKKHDETIGFLSQLTHCIAVSLMTCRDMSGMAEYSGDSFRDLTRIAKINDEMWSELFSLNKNELIKQMDLFQESFLRLKELIENDDREKMREIMRLSTKERELFDRKKEEL